MQHNRTIIVGAGITGLYIGTELAKSRPLIIEAGECGGLAAGFPFFGTTLEKFYHHIFQQDIDITDLCHRFTGSRVILTKTLSGIFAQGRIWPLDTPLDFLKFRPLGSVLDRILMALSLREFMVTEDWGKYDSISCEEYMRVRGSQKGYRNLWEPLLKAKFDGEYENIPASFLWGRVNPRAKSKKGGKEHLGYLQGGFKQLFDGMARYIEENRGSVHTRERVTKIIPGKRPHVITTKDEYECEKVVWTAATDQLAEVLEEAPDDVVRALNSIKYMAANCLIIVGRKKLSDYYWINNIDKDVDFGIVVEHTNLVSPDNYEGRHILYIGNYLKRDHPYLALSANELLDAYWPGIIKIYPDFKKEDIEKIYLFANDHACPVYDLNYSSRIPPYSGLIEGIDIAGMSQVYPYDRSMHNSLLVAKDYCRRALNL
jgi:protoporphyrinogen oxidase